MRPWPSLWEYNPSQKVSSGQPIPTHFCINIAHRAWSYSLKGGEIRLRRAYNQEFWCQAYLYISSNPAGWESESTTSTLKVCSSQREKVLLRRGCTVVLEAPRTFAHGGESLPVASTMLRSRGHQHHGWRGHLLDSRSFLWEKKKKAKMQPMAASAHLLRGCIGAGSATGSTRAECAHAAGCVGGRTCAQHVPVELQRAQQLLTKQNCVKSS